MQTTTCSAEPVSNSQEEEATSSGGALMLVDIHDSSSALPQGTKQNETSNRPELTSQNMHMLQEETIDVSRDGLQKLRSVFYEMAVEGRVTMDMLPFVLVGAEVQVSAKEIHDAMEQHLPDSEDAEALLDFEQVEGLYFQLVNKGIDIVPLVPDEPVIENRSTLRRRVELWFQQKRQQWHRRARERHLKPTTRLLLLILVTSVVISIAIVVFAIIFIWNYSINTEIVHLQRTTELIRSGVQRFGYELPSESAFRKNEDMSALVARVIEDFGHEVTQNGVKNGLLMQQKTMSNFLDQWFEQDATAGVQTAILLSKAWIEQLLQVRELNTVIALIDAMNPALPEGHELVMVVQENGKPLFLTQPRFSGACVGECAFRDDAAAQAALRGETGRGIMLDYRPAQVVASYTWLPAPRLGLIYKVDRHLLRQDFSPPASAVIASINAMRMKEENAARSLRRENSQEVVLAELVEGVPVLNTALRNCDAACLARADVMGSPVGRALQGGRGATEAADFHGEPILAAFGALPLSGLALVVKLATEEFYDELYVSVGKALDFVNLQLPKTREVRFGSHPKDASDSDAVIPYTAFKFAQDCRDACGTADVSEYLQKPVVLCEWGSMETKDYRGMGVIAGYACLPRMKAGLALKVDRAQIRAEGIAMATAIALYQNEVRYAASSTEVELAQKKPGVEVAATAQDFEAFTELRFKAQCPNSICTGNAALMVEAVNQNSGYIKGPDYRNKPAMGAYAYMPGLDIGLVLKVDVAEAEASSLTLTLELAGCSVGAVLFSVAVLAALANVLLRSVDNTWEEDKRTIEREKQQFRSVVEAMYPGQVAQRMLAGDTDIVYPLPAAAVFFSDLYEFTSTANFVTPQELIQFLGYTFGVMDGLADHYHVYKVKTIGDAYLGAAGMPGVEPVYGSSALDMLLFASCCVQVFSARFLHPEEGDILDAVVRNLLGRQHGPGKGPSELNAPGDVQIAYVPRKPSLLQYGAAGDGKALAKGAAPVVHCIMRYGIALGPVTAGVLQGRTPLFDIWGRTVNLASRMESTGQPGRIQVTEALYQAVARHRDQPFTFAARHKVFCRGFGHVNAYFVNACALPPPKALLAALHIEPNLGQFYFDNPVQGYTGAGAVVTGSHHESSHRSASASQQSDHSESYKVAPKNTTAAPDGIAPSP